MQNYYVRYECLYTGNVWRTALHSADMTTSLALDLEYLDGYTATIVNNNA